MLRYFSCVIVFSLWLNCAQAADDVAVYSVTFNATWSAQTHPHPTGSFPGGAHFSSLIGAVHNSSVSFWKPGELASPGIEIMAERGGTSTLQSEIVAAGNKALSVVAGSGLSSPGSTSISAITLNRNYPLITLVTMVAPTPDWFAGVSGLNLQDPSGAWKDSEVVTLYPWDAGSDDGPDYTSPDIEPAVHQPIKSLRNVAPFSDAPVGTFTFTRTNKPAPNVIAFSQAAKASPATAPVGQTISFSAAAAGTLAPVTSYQWNFGDGATDIGANASHAYSLTGVYTATVTATDGTVSASSTVQVSVTPAPVNVITFTGGPVAAPNPAYALQSVSFSAAATGTLAPVTSYQWNFGDGATASGANASHAYSLIGVYTATVTASDGTVSAASSVQVTVTPAPVNVIAFTSGPVAAPNPAYVLQSVSFAAAATGTLAPVTNYQWDFGDGATASGAAVTHAYTAPGNYIAVVTASDGKTSASAAVPVTAQTAATLSSLVGDGKDSDGDGFSDKFETAAAADPLDKLSTPLNGAALTRDQIQRLAVDRTIIRLNFNRVGSDNIVVTGSFSLSPQIALSGKKVWLDIGGVTAGFTLDTAGRGLQGRNWLIANRVLGAAGAQTVRFRASLNGSFAAPLADEGLTAESNQLNAKRSVTISLVTAGQVFQQVKSLSYSSKKGSFGLGN